MRQSEQMQIDLHGQLFTVIQLTQQGSMACRKSLYATYKTMFMLADS